jgi:drug/metabolite transporter (DMT)-like permease
MNVAIALSIAIIFAAMGDVLFSKGMKAHGEVVVHRAEDVWPLIRRVTSNPLVLAGVFSMAVHLCAYIAALEYVDVSVANPLTALSYVLATTYAVLFMREHVGKRRWAGVFFITLGAILVGLSS